jgi:hypothetical protein
MTAVVILSCALALAWLPIAIRFLRGWKSRKNPVSLAIFAALLLFAYTNILFAMALTDQCSWSFFAIATHAFDAVVILNFYVSFYWSDKKFEGTRHGDSMPVPNTTSTQRRS